jgi:hypothetical protein
MRESTIQNHGTFNLTFPNLLSMRPAGVTSCQRIVARTTPVKSLWKIDLDAFNAPLY